MSEFDKKISALSAGGAAQATDEYVIARAGGNFKVTGANVAAAATALGTLSSLTVSGDLTVDTSTLKVDSANNRVGIGTASPATTLSIDNTRSDTPGSGFLTYTNAAVTSGRRGVRVDTNNGLWVDYYNGSSWSGQLALDASGNLGLGVTPSVPFHVKAANNEIMRLQSSDATTGSLYFSFYDSADAEKGYIGYGSGATDEFYFVQRKNAAMAFFTNATEAARITSGGDVLVGKTSDDAGTVGVTLSPLGFGRYVRDGEALLLLRRNTSDGDLVLFRRDGSDVGSISVSGGTVSYNAFAGSHWSQLEDGSKPEILRGTVMEALDELCEWPNETNERLPKAKVSDTAGSKKVYGVFMDWDNDWTETNDMYVTAVGAFICRVAADVVVEQGDLLESNGDGTARVQADDVIRSSTIGKVTSTVKTHEYEDGTYCVPTVLYCG